MEVEPSERRTVLIVDDDVGAIRLLSAMLGDQAQVLFATDGESGLRLAAQRQPQLVLLDVEMPGMSGYEVCKALVQDPRTRECPVIMITAHAGADSEVAALEAGAVDFICKPFNPPVVRARVRTHLRLQEQSAALARLANTDSLTGLYNRRHFDAELAVELLRHSRQQLPLGLALIDVDHFKAYNDGYGHPQGDACLRQVAAAIAASARRPGETASRYGGEEFAVILPYTDESDATKFGELLCASVRELSLEHAYSKSSDRVTVSVGLVSAQPRHGDTPEMLKSAADRALYAAKAAGRNRWELAEWAP